MATERRSSENEEKRSFEIDPEIKRYFSISEDGVTLPFFTPPKLLEGLKQFEVRPSDVFVLSYSKAGTTLTQYIATQILHGQVDKKMMELFFFLEMSKDGFITPDTFRPEVGGIYKLAEQAPSPRMMKCHLPMKNLPPQIFTKKPKVIYVARNPKDTAVSFYNFSIIGPSLPTYRSWPEFYEYYHRGLVPYGDWFSHVLPFWDLRDEPNVFFLKYEDILRDMRGTVDKMSKFLEKPITPKQLAEISQNATFDEMRKNKNVNYDLMDNVFDSPPIQPPGMATPKFMRKGKVGDWRNYFTLAQNDRFDELYRTKMADTDLQFYFGDDAH